MADDLVVLSISVDLQFKLDVVVLRVDYIVLGLELGLTGSTGRNCTYLLLELDNVLSKQHLKRVVLTSHGVEVWFMCDLFDLSPVINP